MAPVNEDEKRPRGRILRTPDEPRERWTATKGGGRSAAWKIGVGGGLAIAIVGWFDVLVGWYPPQFGSMEWEFATISRMFDSLPLGTVGFLALVAGLVARPEGKRALKAAAVFSGVIFAFLGAAAVLYGLNAIPAWTGSAPPLRATLRIALPRTTLFILTYMALYAWLAWFAWRQARKRSG